MATIALWFSPELSGQSRRHIVFDQEHAVTVHASGGELRPALGDCDGTVGVGCVVPLDEQLLDFRLAGVREEIQW